ncbi:PREDICTED: scopoletin glucosyltransferase-like [Nicotiana attenuata]|uniref:Glycosyltransferase n=1 Tax=Nicotiana attenuata TaxID=49451 RepID=A0A1J6JUV7_NICAT|nr:PREDICTED: scopoletin glucosyltransferase-like [Nicotiana attenuata]AQQ16710.1 UDP-glycosyltransferase g34878 [Nicotiana attenuata]OIT21525.1 udp-glucose flavonoid 3-o-glucosyltransferase 7 [Nicotiana attenuata]
MDRKTDQLHIYFLPMMAPGHMIPLVDIARQFARRGAKVTIITTPLNASTFSKAIQRDRELGSDISNRTTEFPCKEAGLPDGCENIASTTSTEMYLKFIMGLSLFQQPFEQFLEEDHPDCLVAAPQFSWAVDVAAKLGIPRLFFNGTGFFPLCALHSLMEHKPHLKVESETEEFIIPGLPDTIKMSRQQLPDHLKCETESIITEIVRNIMKAEMTSYGSIVNSFYELEPYYVKHWELKGRKAWHIGPVSLYNKDNEDKAQRGHGTSFCEHQCLDWLNTKEPKSVIYICFGSMSVFSSTQLLEIAMALEASNQQFIWATQDAINEEQTWMPEGFEEKLKGQGLIIKGWVPQVLILDHEAIGGFVTHCGWNSLLEGVTAGVPMVTWPLSAEQFFNEKLPTEILKIGVPVGAQAWSYRTDSTVPINRENIQGAITKLMVGQEAEEMRSRAAALGNLAKMAVEKGGSSDNSLGSLLEELRKRKSSSN